MSVEVTKVDDGEIWIVSINRPSVRNCVDGPTADQLSKIFISFDNDERSRVAVLYGKGGCFCAGADLKAVGKVDGASQKMLHVGPVNSNGADTGKYSIPVSDWVYGRRNFPESINPKFGLMFFLSASPFSSRRLWSNFSQI